MLKVTDQAVDMLTEILEGAEASGEQGLRLAQSAPGQFGIEVDQPRDGDQVVEKEQRPVLLIEREVSDALDGATLDVTEAPEGPRLSLQMPDMPGEDGAR